MTISYFENAQLFFPAISTLQIGVSEMLVDPFVLNDAISFNVLRFPVSFGVSSTTQTGTSADSTASAARLITVAAVIYSQGAGASSNSLMSITSGNGLLGYSTFYGGNSNGSEYTISYSATWPTQNFTNNNYTTSYAVTSSRINVSTESQTIFTGAKLLDIPMATSLSAGNYWLGFGVAAAFTTNAGLNFMSSAFPRITEVMVSQNNLTLGHLAAATNATNQLQPGAGRFSTNSTLFSTSGMDLSQIIIKASNPRQYFQLINRA